MTKEWYPIINYETCTECGACVEKCTHGVYQKETKKPQVIYIEGCIDQCRGCQKLCPSGSIAYFGDACNIDGCACKTGSDCGCGCDCT